MIQKPDVTHLSNAQFICSKLAFTPKAGRLYVCNCGVETQRDDTYQKTLKAVQMWGIEPCNEHPRGGVFSKRECPKCWQTLKEDVKYNTGVHYRHCYQGENEDNCKYGYEDCPAKPSTADRECYVTCSKCGTKVSNTVLSSLPEGLVVRAFVECADCVAKHSSANKGGEVINYMRTNRSLSKAEDGSQVKPSANKKILDKLEEILAEHELNYIFNQPEYEHFIYQILSLFKVSHSKGE